MRRSWLGIAFLLVSSVSVSAADGGWVLEEIGSSWWGQGEGAEAGPSCSGGLILDDGTFEIAIWGPEASDLRLVQRFTPTGGYPVRVDQVCTCWVRNGDGGQTTNFKVQIYDDNGPGGAPGTLLGQQADVVSLPDPDVFAFFATACTDLNVTIPSGGFYVGAQWNSASAPGVFLCVDTSLTSPTATAYASFDGALSWPPMNEVYAAFKAFGVRTEVSLVPPPPATGAFTSDEFPGYQFWVRFAGTKIGVADEDCLPLTICVAAAPGSRIETFLRIVGPKPDGFLWFAVAKFNLPKTEIWAQQLSSGKLNYYLLPAVTESESEIPGFVDKRAFLP